MMVDGTGEGEVIFLAEEFHSICRVQLLQIASTSYHRNSNPSPILVFDIQGRVGEEQGAVVAEDF